MADQGGPAGGDLTIVEPPLPGGDKGSVIPLPDAGSNDNASGVVRSAPPSAQLGQQIQGLEQAIGDRLSGPSKLQSFPEPPQTIQTEGPYYSDDGGKTWKLIPSPDAGGNLPNVPSGSLCCARRLRVALGLDCGTRRVTQQGGSGKICSKRRGRFRLSNRSALSQAIRARPRTTRARAAPAH